MLKQDRFSKQEYDLGQLKTESTTPSKPPLAKKSFIPPRLAGKQKNRPTADKSLDSAHNTSTVSKGSKLSELCDEDKSKIGNLIQRLALETEQKKRAEEEVNRVKQQYQREIEALMDQNKRLVENSKAIEQRYNEVSEIVKKAVDKSAKTRDHIYIEKENAQMLTTQRPDFEAIAGNKSPKHDTLHKVPPKPTKQKPKKKQEEPELKESLKRTVERKAPENSGQSQSNQHFASTLPLPSEQPPAQARARYLLPQRGMLAITRGI